MPYDRVTPFGTQHGLVSQEEQFNQQRAQSDAARQAQLAAIQAQLQMHGQSDATQRYGIDTGLKQMGSYDQRAAHEMGIEGLRGTNQLASDKIRMGPNQAYADIATGEYNDGKPLRDLKTQFAVKLFGGMLGGAGGAPASAPAMGPGNALVGGGGAPSAAPAGKGMYDGMMGYGSAAPRQATAAPQMGGQDQFERDMMAYSVMNGGQMPDLTKRRFEQQALELELEDRKRNRTDQDIKGYADSGNWAKANELATQSGRPLKNQKIEEFMAAEGATLGGDLTSLSKKFGERDIDDFGADPGEGEMQQIQAERDRLVQILVGRNYPIDQATREANRIIANSLGGEQHDWEADASKQLRGRLGF